MASASLGTGRRWLKAVTDLATAAGREHLVVEWAEQWASKRGFRTRRDDAGNLTLYSPSRTRRSRVVAVAHMDHPALVVKEATTHSALAELRGGVLAPYLENARIEVGGRVGRVVEFDPDSQEARVQIRGAEPGDILRWHFDASRLGYRNGRLAARACDDLAGVAAALIALDRAEARGIHHFSVLLTRAEEVGFIGAIAACHLGTVPEGARLLSIECSPALPEAPPGAGPVVRVGDAASIFSADLTNKVSTLLRRAGLPFQRKLMAGGSCEATAFAALGINASGLCLPLVNHHNMVDVQAVRERRKPPRLAPEEIDLGDFDGLVELLVTVAENLDRHSDSLPFSLADLYAEQRHLLV